MAETNVENKMLMLSGRALLEKLGDGESMTIKTKGFYRKYVEGKTTIGQRKFSGYQIRFIPRDENDPMISISETSAGGKMILRQMEEFKKQFADKGELGNYESDVEFKHVTSIKDKVTGEMKETDFLSVQVIPTSLGKRTFTPSTSGFSFKLPEENTEKQLSNLN